MKTSLVKKKTAKRNSRALIRIAVAFVTVVLIGILTILGQNDVVRAAIGSDRGNGAVYAGVFSTKNVEYNYLYKPHDAAVSNIVYFHSTCTYTNHFFPFKITYLDPDVTNYLLPVSNTIGQYVVIDIKNDSSVAGIKGSSKSYYSTSSLSRTADKKAKNYNFTVNVDASATNIYPEISSEIRKSTVNKNVAYTPVIKKLPSGSNSSDFSEYSRNYYFKEDFNTYLSYTNAITYYRVYTDTATRGTFKEPEDLIWQRYNDYYVNGSAWKYIYADFALARCYGTMNEDADDMKNVMYSALNNANWVKYDPKKGIPTTVGGNKVIGVQFVTTGVACMNSAPVWSTKSDNPEGYIRFATGLFCGYEMKLNYVNTLDVPTLSSAAGFDSTKGDFTGLTFLSKDDNLILSNPNTSNAFSSCTDMSLQYIFSKDRLATSALNEIKEEEWNNYTEPLVPVEIMKDKEGEMVDTGYLYTRVMTTYSDSNLYKSSPVKEFTISTLEVKKTKVVSSQVDQNQLKLGDVITLSADAGEEIFYTLNQSAAPTLTRLSFTESNAIETLYNAETDHKDAGEFAIYDRTAEMSTVGYYLRINNMWYKSSEKLLQGPITIDQNSFSNNTLTIYAAAYRNGIEVEPITFSAFHYYRYVGAPSVKLETNYSLISKLPKGDTVILTNNNRDASGATLGTVYYSLSYEQKSMNDVSWTLYTDPIPVEGKSFLYVKTEYDAATTDGFAMKQNGKINTALYSLRYLSNSSVTLSTNHLNGSNLKLGDEISLASDSTFILYTLNTDTAPSLLKVKYSDRQTLGLDNLLTQEQLEAHTPVLKQQGDKTYLYMNHLWYVFDQNVLVYTDSIPVEASTFVNQRIRVHAAAFAADMEPAEFTTYSFYEFVDSPVAKTESGISLSTEDATTLPYDDTILLANNPANASDIPGKLQYYLSKTKLEESSVITGWTDYNPVNGITPQGRNYLYTRYVYIVSGVSKVISSAVTSYELEYFETQDTPVTYSVPTGSQVNAGDDLTLTGSGNAILYVLDPEEGKKPALTKVDYATRMQLTLNGGLDSGEEIVLKKVNNTTYLRINNLWYQSTSNKLILVSGDSVTVKVPSTIETNQLSQIYAMNLESAKNISEFQNLVMLRHLAAPLLTTESGTSLDKPISNNDEIRMDFPSSNRIGSLQYCMTDSKLEPTEVTGWLNYTGPIQPQKRKYLYTRIIYSVGDVLVTSPAEEMLTEMTYLSSATTTVTADRETGTTMDVGDSVKLTGTGTALLYSLNQALTPTLTKVSSTQRVALGLDAMAATNKDDELVVFRDDAGIVYVRVNNLWYQGSNGLQISSGEAITADDSMRSRGNLIIHAISLKQGEEIGEFTAFRYKFGMNDQVAAPTAMTNQATASAEEATIVSYGNLITLMTQTTYADNRMVPIFYTLDGSAPMIEIGENGPQAGPNTYLYENDIQVTEAIAGYGQSFTIMAQAVYYEKQDDVWYRVMKDSSVSRFLFTVEEQEVAAPVTAVPATTAEKPTMISPGAKVLLSSATSGATIFYTIDGSEPIFTAAGRDENGIEIFTLGENTYQYKTGVIVPDAMGETLFTITAVAYKEGLKNSAVSRLTYSYPSMVLAPYTNPSAGSVAENTLVSLQCGTEGAVIYYEIAYGDQEAAAPTVNSNVFDATNPFKITGKTTIKAYATKDGMNSSVSTFVFTVSEKLTVPTASIPASSVVPSGTVLTLSAANEATIYYTTDGSDPKEEGNSSVMIGNSVVIAGDAGAAVTVRTYAGKSGYSNSDSIAYTYTISAYEGGVYVDKESGTVVRIGDVIHLGTDVSGGVIYFTTDGSTPTTGSASGTNVTVTGTPGGSFQIVAFAVVSGTNQATAYASFKYDIMDQLAAPTASVPTGATFTKQGQVTLSAAAGTIFYTTDGSTPTTASSVYKTGITIKGPLTIKAIASSADFQTSPVATFHYKFASQVATPSASLESGELEIGTEVEFGCTTEGAVIYYRTDGKVPDPSDNGMTLRYTGPITIEKATNFKVIAVKNHMQDSEVLQVGYTVKEIVVPEEEEETSTAAEPVYTSGRLQSRRSYLEGGSETTYTDVVIRNNVYGVLVDSERDNIQEKAGLTVEHVQVASTTERLVVQRLGEDYGTIDAYHVALLVDGEEQKPLGEIEVGIPIPADYQNAVVTLTQIGEDGTIAVCESRRSEGMLYTKTSDLGIYALTAPINYDADKKKFPWVYAVSVGCVAILILSSMLIYRAISLRKEEEDE